MAAEPGVMPLRRQSFSSADADEVTDFIAKMYAGNRSTFSPLRRPPVYRAVVTDSATLSGDDLRCTMDHRCSTDAVDYFLAYVVYQGTVRLSSKAGDVRLGPGDTLCYPLGLPQHVTMSDMGVRTIRLPKARVEEAAEVLGLPGAQLRLDGLRPVSPAMERYWRQVIGLVHGSLNEAHSPMSHPLLSEEMTRLTALAALHVFPNTTLTQHHLPGPGRVSPAAVRRAMSHIEANAHLPLTLADIAASARIGPRALQHAFRRHLDTTPMTYLRRVRLEHVHRALQAGDPQRGDTVADIAATWGFLKPSRFAHQYRTSYGELPSRTL